MLFSRSAVKLAALALIILASSAAPSHGGFSEVFSGKLVKLDPDSDELRPYELPTEQPPEYYMIYFSAHWCPPCRKTTPALVRFYNETRREHPGFEFILVSDDHTPEAMAGYLRWAEMPWPALAWEKRGSIPAINKLSPRAIPFMAMLDADGRMLGASDVGGFHVGIPKLINGLQDKLGTEVYDLHERHGQRSPWTLIAYGLAGGFFLLYAARRILKRPGRSPPPDSPG